MASVPDDIILKRALQCSGPFDCSPSRFSHRLFELNFHRFPPPPLPPACELFASLLLSIVLVGSGFFPTFAEETFVYYILADLENKVGHP